MGKVLIRLAALVLILTGFGALAEDNTARIHLTLRGWFTGADMSNKAVEDLFGDLDDGIKKIDLGKEVAPEGRLRFQIAPRHGIELRYLNVVKEADDTFFKPMLFRHNPSLFMSRVKSNIDFTYARLGWHWAVIETDNGVFKLETIVDITGGWAKGEYNHFRVFWPFSPDSKDIHDVAGALPTVGLGATISPIPWLDVFGEVSGIMTPKYGYIFDWEAGLRVNPFKWLGIEGGYHYVDIEGPDNEGEPKFRFTGPFCGAKLRF